ncbi:hypothetical protein KCU73_g9458, partial [Aureobasidium melanogenum]
MASSTTPEQCSYWLPGLPCENLTATLREIAENEEIMYAQTQNAQTVDMVLADKPGTVEDKQQTADGETTSMAESETDTLVAGEDDAWSVVSDGGGAVNDESERLSCEDEADDENEVNNASQDADVDQEDLYGCT